MPKEDNDLLSTTAKGASYLVLLQFLSRMLTFSLNQAVLQFVSKETFGLASVNLELLSSTILFISREGFRSALIRSNKSQQIILNLAYIPTLFGLVMTILTCIWYLHNSSKDTYYQYAVLLYGLASFLELLIEPLFILALNKLYFQLRVKIEGLAVILRCLVTFGLTLYLDSTQGILAFAVAQLVYGITIMLGYFTFFLFKEKSIKSLIPNKLDGYWFDGALLTLGLTMTKQSLLKHVLTEGDKMLISVLSTEQDRGVYALVVNYGSLIARILFQPLEETGRTFFSKLLLDKNKNEKTAYNVLLVLIRFHVLLGLVFICFATNYTNTLIDLMLGKRWILEAPQVLSMYCIYVPVMGINGVTESFVQAVASKSDLTRLSYFMFLFSICFIASGIVFMYWLKLGAIGLILANIVNLGIRVCYSWNYIKGYFSMQVSIKQWLPHPITFAAFVTSWFVTYLSESMIGWYTLKQKLYHIIVGGIAFLVTSGVMYWKEKDLIVQIKNLRHQKFE